MNKEDPFATGNVREMRRCFDEHFGNRPKSLLDPVTAPFADQDQHGLEPERAEGHTPTPYNQGTYAFKDSALKVFGPIGPNPVAICDAPETAAFIVRQCNRPELNQTEAAWLDKDVQQYYSKLEAMAGRLGVRLGSKRGETLDTLSIRLEAERAVLVAANVELRKALEKSKDNFCEVVGRSDVEGKNECYRYISTIDSALSGSASMEPNTHAHPLARIHALEAALRSIQSMSTGVRVQQIVSAALAQGGGHE